MSPYAWPKTNRWSDFHRLRKYRRRVDRALRSGSRRSREEALTLLRHKWHYWGKFYGGETPLWGEIVPTGEPPARRKKSG